MDRAAAVRERLKGLFPGMLGIEFTEVTSERVVATLTVRPELCNVGDTLHGGAIMGFADTLGAVATFTNFPTGARMTTIESKTNFLAAVPVGSCVVGECVPIHRGRTTMVWQTQIKGASDQLVAVVIQTQLILRP
jgi:uncharacterized protein (TIGR00369 family)